MNSIHSLRTLTLSYLALLLASLFEPLSVCSVSWATTFIPRPFEEYVLRAPQIIRGVTGSHRSDWSNDSQGTRRIYTFTELKVAEVLKGNPRDFPVDSTVSLREIGGQKDGVGLMIAGTAEFKEGEEVVVFISSQQNADGSFDLSNMMMSKLSVLPSDSSGESETLAGPALEIQAHTPTEMHSNHTESNSSENKKIWNLEQLRSLIRQQTGASDPIPSKTNLESSTSPQVSEPLRSQKIDETQNTQTEGILNDSSSSSENPKSQGGSVIAWVGFFLFGVFALAYRWFRK